MRAILFAAATLLCGNPALAQDASAETDLARAARMLAASWRPIPGLATAGLETAIAEACEGAPEELSALDAALPDNLSAPALQAVRAQRGLVVVATEDPGAAYLFPGPDLPGVASGLAAMRLVDAAAGRVSLTDAAGREIQLQLGVAGGRAMMRVLSGDGAPQVYVGCVATSG